MKNKSNPGGLLKRGVLLDPKVHALQVEVSRSQRAEAETLSQLKAMNDVEAALQSELAQTRALLAFYTKALQEVETDSHYPETIARNALNQGSDGTEVLSAILAAKVVCNDYDLECEDCNGTLDKLKKTTENMPDKTMPGEK